MGKRPSGSQRQFPRARRQCHQIRHVIAAPINRRKEFEVYLVEPVYEIHAEVRLIRAGVKPVAESKGKSHLKQASFIPAWFIIEPGFRQIQQSRYFIRGPEQVVRQRDRRRQPFATLEKRNNIDITGSTGKEPHGNQGGAAAYHEMNRGTPARIRRPSSSKNAAPRRLLSRS